MKLSDFDPATLMQSPEVNAVIATEWMGWHLRSLQDADQLVKCWVDAKGKAQHRCVDWNPSGNVNHAGEARRKAPFSSVIHASECVATNVPAECVVAIEYCGSMFISWCPLSEVDGDKAHAEEIATSRVIVEALQGRTSDE